jgi:hypothetical protein
LFGAESDFEVCFFEDVCDVCGFSAYVCEIGPFLDGVGGCGFVGVGVCVVLSGRSYCGGCYVLCSVLVGILYVVICRTQVCCVGI